MAKPNIINLNDLLGIDEDENNKNETDNKGITELNISDLVPFKNHPFRLYEGQRLDDMVESIKEHGIITPLIVRKLENNTYEILSGHNRVNAGKLAGLKKVPVVIKEGLTDEEAMLIVTETNLIQRSFAELSHSEKARILAERHNAIKEQGRKTDLINEIEMMSNSDGYEENPDSGRICPQGETRDKIAGAYDLSPRNVSNYLRIDMLIDELKIRLDNNGEIPFTAGVNLSHLNTGEQETVEDILQNHGFKVDLKKSDVLKALSQGRNFNHNKAYEVLSGKYFDKPKKKKKPKFTAKFTKTIIEKYVTEDVGIKDIEILIEEFLEKHFSQNNQKEMDVEREENQDEIEI